MEKKFYIKELLQFFKEKRRGVVLDDDFIFSVEEFKKFIAENKLPQKMFDKTSFDSIEEALKYLKGMDVRDENNHIINPPLALLSYLPRKDKTGFEVQNSRAKYFKNTVNYIRVVTLAE